MKRKICVFTGTRAEYGLLKPLMREIQQDNTFKLQLMVSGMHLSHEFGLTCREIEEDGFDIDEKVEILLSSDTPVGICKSTGIGLIGYGEALMRLIPESIIILGDRFEALACAVASTVTRIPIIHIHGGEVTQGAIDEAFRHSITKMSHIHFTATEEYRKRVIQLGENPEKVFNVGALGIDNIRHLKLLSKEDLESELDFRFKKRNILATVHPVTAEEKSSEPMLKNLLEVLEESEDTGIIFTKANADAGGRVINRMIDEWTDVNGHRAVSFASMGQLNYLSAMQFVDAVVGNSSSGIIEAPSFRIGTINIGNRQKGRIRADSVIDCEPSKEGVGKAITKLYSESFQKSLKNVVNPYGTGDTSKRIVKVLKKGDLLLKNATKKIFYDLDCQA
ncbi:MAG: UDP-N-acetylglucosamine 2-epimerase (hydrolyzing) [Spirochaetota bacterium]|nr:MAG: UDP-N-acetylglucosamine 2-epimerase (hydrolyzing) [Spirochaetota bacterium]